jgi:hypothetical protein
MTDRLRKHIRQLREHTTAALGRFAETGGPGFL